MHTVSVSDIHQQSIMLKKYNCDLTITAITDSFQFKRKHSKEGMGRGQVQSESGVIRKLRDSV